MFDSLNPVQRSAVEYGGSEHCLILAGAGSGKTRVLTHRIAWLIRKGIDPRDILAITFTNKAAKEMRERCANMLTQDNADATLPMMTTFHSFGAYFIRRFIDFCDLRAGFVIYDESEQLQIIKEIAGDSQGDENKELLRLFATIKDNAESREDIEARAHMTRRNDLPVLFEKYNAKLREYNAADFSDLIALPLRMLENNDSLRRKASLMYRYILVDEFQDTNASQLRLLKLLSERALITAVGDDDQSIYTWRGANPENILSFEQYYGKTAVFKLEQNYRSVSPILKVASKLIARNRKRYDKTLWTSAEGGKPVECFCFDTDRDEARFVAGTIAKLEKRGYSFGDFLILFRTNGQARLFEESLRQNLIPYQIVGGLGFFERAEIKDLMAYLRVLVNPSDRLAMVRMINTPKRGLGEKNIQKIFDNIDILSDSDLEPGRRLVVALKNSKLHRKNLDEQCKNLAEILETCMSMPSDFPSCVLEYIVEKIAFVDYARKNTKSDPDEVEKRIYDLIESLREFEENSDADNILHAFLEQMALVRPESDDGRSCVKLMTIHSAKGLEFPVVFITGLEENLLPLCKEDYSDIEEERRLTYVAMTRAKKELYLTRALLRRRFKYVQECSPSRFIRECDPCDEFIFKNYDRSKNRFDGSDSDNYRFGTNNHFENRKSFQAAGNLTSNHSEIPIVRKKIEQKFAVGENVTHVTFGIGKVLRVEDGSEGQRVTVDFPLGGIKTIVGKFLRKS